MSKGDVAEYRACRDLINELLKKDMQWSSRAETVRRDMDKLWGFLNADEKAMLVSEEW